MTSIQKRRAYVKHGLTNTPEYRIWASMIQRCINQYDQGYANYGGRGITVCERWIDSFINFYNDMGKRPEPSLSLDRIKSDKGYSPDNCRWTNITIQNLNKRPWRISKSGYKGVQQKRNKYASTIWMCGTTHYIGYFDTKEEAAYMYDCFALSLYGDEARTNFKYY